MKNVLLCLLLLTPLSAPAAVLYDGIRTGYQGLRDFFDTDDRAALYFTTGSTGYRLDSADLMRVWNAAPFNTWPTGAPQLTLYGTVAGSNLGNGIEAQNPADLIGSMAFTAVTEPRGTTAATQEIVSLIPTAPLVMEAGRNYWLVVTMASGNGMSLINSTGSGPLNQNLMGSATLPGNALSPASGGLSLRLLGEAIPEPTSTLLTLLAAPFLLRRRRC